MASNGKHGFCIPYTVRDTLDKGRGVFSDAAIRKGTILWRYVRGQCAVYDERSLQELVDKLTPSKVVYELEHMFGLAEFPCYVIRVIDDGVLINHSRQPTLMLNSGSGDVEIPYNRSPQHVQDVEDALLNDRFDPTNRSGLSCSHNGRPQRFEDRADFGCRRCIDAVCLDRLQYICDC